MNTIEIRYKNYGNLERAYRLEKVRSLSEWWREFNGRKVPRYTICVKELKALFPTKAPPTGGVLYISTLPISHNLFMFDQRRLLVKCRKGWERIPLIMETRMEFEALLASEGIPRGKPFYAHFEWDI